MTIAYAQYPPLSSLDPNLIHSPVTFSRQHHQFSGHPPPYHHQHQLTTPYLSSLLFPPDNKTLKKRKRKKRGNNNSHTIISLLYSSSTSLLSLVSPLVICLCSIININSPCPLSSIFVKQDQKREK